MKCENLQFNLSLYSDNFLTEDERALTDAHLAQCPLCRQKLADFQSLRNNLRGLARPEIPNYLLSSLRSAVATELKTVEEKPSLIYSESFRRWLEFKLMPYSVGLVTSLVMTFFLLGTLLSDVNQPNTEIARVDTKYKSPVILANSQSGSNGNFGFSSDEFALKPEDFAAARISVSGESPSVNPAGALIALTKSFVRGKMKDEEVVIVADVFSNGLAQISSVIEPSRDEQTMRELEKALKTDPDFAPFVPASFDNRADSVQIVLKIQRVDVVDRDRKNHRK
jgi:hypothetical protein